MSEFAPEFSQTERRLGLFTALGMMTAVSSASEYRIWTVGDIEQYFLPPLLLGQNKVYLDDDGMPLAFVTWALLDEACHNAILSEGRNPAADQWASGDHLWFMDFVAVGVHPISIIRDLQKNHFPGRHAHSIRRDAEGGIRRVCRWRNIF